MPSRRLQEKLLPLFIRKSLVMSVSIVVFIARCLLLSQSTSGSVWRRMEEYVELERKRKNVAAANYKS